MTPLARDLLAHYAIHARMLPWRLAPQGYAAGLLPDPYRVWLSESMLQQTQVKTVIPYYARFLQAFPSLPDLAQAEREQVFALWAGLGYYARAKNLHAGAGHVLRQHAGRFPSDAAALRAVPGVGVYTAAALQAIAFNLPVLPVDGNVRRVSARLFADEDLACKALALHVPAQAGADFAQALMDLGSGICTPRAPDCVRCPIERHCATRSDALPRPVVKTPKTLVSVTAWAVFDAAGRVHAPVRPIDGLWGGMRGLPLSEAPPFDDVQNVRRGKAFRHVLTHRVFHVTPVRAFRNKVDDAVDVNTPMPMIMRKCLQALAEAESD